MLLEEAGYHNDKKKIEGLLQSSASTAAAAAARAIKVIQARMF